MKYFLNGTWVNDSTITILPKGATLLSDTEWDNRQNVPYKLTPAEIAEAARQTAKAALVSIDRASIRSLREWVAAQPTAPQFLKTQEAAALIQRAKII